MAHFLACMAYYFWLSETHLVKYVGFSVYFGILYELFSGSMPYKSVRTMSYNVCFYKRLPWLYEMFSEHMPYSWVSADLAICYKSGLQGTSSEFQHSLFSMYLVPQVPNYYSTTACSIRVSTVSFQ